MHKIKTLIDEYDIAQEIRLERAVHKGSFLVLEGKTDLKRFSKFIDDIECSTVNAWGRDNAIKAIKLLYEDGFAGAVACVDADFDRLLGGTEAHEGIVYSAGHDLDMDWVTKDNLELYLGEVAAPEKVKNCGGVEGIRNKIVEGLKFVSVARFLNRKGIISEKLSDIDCSNCFDGFRINEDKYIDEVCCGYPFRAGRKEELKEKIAKAVSLSFDMEQLTNGHDFHCALGASLRRDLGSRRDVHTWGSEVEMHLRLCFGDTMFKKTAIFDDLKAWEAENSPYIVLHTRLTA